PFKDAAETGVLGGTHKLAYSLDGKLLAAASEDKTVHIWDVATGNELQRLAHQGPVLTVAFSPDGTLLASSDGLEVRLWDPRTGKALHAFKMQRSYQSPLAFSPDGKLLAYAVRDGTVCLWSIEAGKELFQFAASSKQIQSLIFSPDGKVLLSGGFAC